MSASDDERAIRSVIETWMTASQAGDVAKVLSLMADDALFLVPGREPFGKEQFAASAGGMKEVRMEGRSDVKEVVVAGDWAWARTHIAVTMTPPGGQPVRRSGYALSVFRRTPTRGWVLFRDANLLGSG
jgi:uncharacterized protein (TIGR02246 family)